jgi:hypothetical protein
MRQAFAPLYGWATGTCCCQLVMPLIIPCAGSPFDSTSHQSPSCMTFTVEANSSNPEGMTNPPDSGTVVAGVAGWVAVDAGRAAVVVEVSPVVPAVVDVPTDESAVVDEPNTLPPPRPHAASSAAPSPSPPTRSSARLDTAATTM